MTTVFDLDGVLSRTDTMAALIRYLNRQRPSRLARIAPAVVLALLASPHGERRAALNRWSVRTALHGISVDEYRTGVQFVAEQLAHTPNNFPARAQEALRAAKAGGSTWVVTASEESMSKAYLQRIGQGEIPVLGSTLSTTPPLQISMHTVGAAKVAALTAAGVSLGDAHLFTDSASDADLAQACRNTTLVNGSPRTARILGDRGIAVQQEIW